MKNFFIEKKKSIITVIACICALAIIVPLCIWWMPKSKNEDDALHEVTVFSKEDSGLIEESIISSEQNVDSLILYVDDDSPLVSLETGDVFVISQGFSDIFGEVYFGKIASKRTDGNNELIEVVTPAMDEIFNSLDLDCNVAMSANNIESINLADGVKLVETGELNAPSLKSNHGTIMQMKNSLSHDFYIDGNDIGFKFDVDLLDLFKKQGVISNTEVNAERITTADKANNTNVYYTNTGLCYHRINCRCLAKSKHEISLKKAVHETNLQPCKVCEAPILVYDNIEEKISTSTSLKLEGNVVLSDLSFRIVCADGDDWDIKNGFSNLSVKTEGTLKAETTIKGNLKGSISGTPTRSILIGDEKNPKIYFEGLNEKLLPLAFITMNAGFFTVKVGPACDEVVAPFTIALMLYTDMNGNITVGTKIYCSYTKSLSCQYDVFRDGEFVKSGDALKIEDDSSFDWRLKAEGEAQVDLRAFNASLMLYVGNVNILEFCLARTGIEASGNIVLTASNDSSQNALAANAKMCVYVELLDLDVKYKYKDKKDLINVDPSPLYRFDLAKFEYSYNSSQESGSKSIGEQFLSILQQYEEKYGVINNDVYIENGSTEYDKLYELGGLCYADLVDFDGNGKDEIILGYDTIKSKGVEYIFEVWENIDGKATKIYEFNPFNHHQSVFEYSFELNLFEKGGKTYIIPDGWTKYSYYELKNHNFELIKKFEEDDYYEPEHFYVDDKEYSYDEYSDHYTKWKANGNDIHFDLNEESVEIFRSIIATTKFRLGETNVEIKYPIDNNPYERDLKIYTDYLLNGGYDQVSLYGEVNSADHEISACMFDINFDNVYELYIKIVDKSSFNWSGYPQTTALLNIYDGRVNIVLSAGHWGGSDGGDDLTVKYDLLSENYVILKSEFKRSGYAYSHNIEKIYGGQNVFGEVIEVISSFSFALPTNFYGYEKSIQKVKNETSLYVESESSFYYYMINDEYVSKHAYEETTKRFVDLPKNEFSIKVGTYNQPIS